MATVIFFKLTFYDIAVSLNVIDFTRPFTTSIVQYLHFLKPLHMPVVRVSKRNN